MELRRDADANFVHIADADATVQQRSTRRCDGARERLFSFLLLVLSAATLAYGRCKWKLCEVGVMLALFIGAAYDYNTVVSNSAACPFLGDVSGSFAMLQSSID
jgi:hypothetical protein